MRCASCQHENPSDARFCERCAADLVPLCPSCEQENNPGALYCRFCRSSLTPEAPPHSARPQAEAPASPAELPSSFASGRYQVKALLGEGGRKRVYRAHDTVLDRDVALAVIKVEGLDPTSRVRITREAQAMGRLGDHPHVLSIHDLGEDNGQPYMVLPLMPGGDIEALLAGAEDHRLPLEQAIDLAMQVCRGLEFAHSKGIVHRDLKPGNVWLTADGTARIGDFGLAVAIDRSRLTQEGMMVGTVSYMPPEQAMGGDVTPQSDLYSLGAMLYEMVTGRPPFLGDDSVAIIGQHINTPPVAPTWHNSECPRALEALILRLLTKNPSERPESAADVLRALEGVDLAVSPDADAPEHDESHVLDSLAGGVFVGRQREMGELKAALEDALSGRGRLVTLVGEPGIGKTRTAEELATYARMRGAQVLWGRCHESRGAPPYWPWVQAIRSYVRETEPERLRSEMGAGAADIAEIVSDVRERLPDLQPSLQLEDPEQARFRLFDSIAAFLKSASKGQPLAIILDNLHWADKPSLLLLEFLAQEFADSRLLVIGTYRDVDLSRQHPLTETLGELTRERLFQRVLLRGLSQDDVGRFLEIMSGITPPRGLVEAVHTQTEGNPLFITEVVRLLVQERELSAERDSWEVRIPEGVREVIGRRLNRLSARCNETLTIASVIGREFELRQLASLLEDLSEERLLEVLDEALSARAIEELPQAVGRYQFSHALIRQTLYDELTTTRRVRLHARIAETLEGFYGDGARDHAAELAEHFAQAETVLGADKLIAYSVAAGNAALDAFGHHDAIVHFERALASIDKRVRDHRMAEVLLGLGRAQAQVLERHDLQAAVDTLTHAFGIFVELGDEENARRVARAEVPNIHGPTGMADLIGRAIELVPKRSPEHAALLSGYIQWASFERAEYDLERIQSALEMAKENDDEALELKVLAGSMTPHGLNGNFEALAENARRGAELIQRVDDPRSAVRILECLTYVSFQTVGMADAEAKAKDLLATAERTRGRFSIGIAHQFLGLVAQARGNLEDAAAYLERGLEYSPREARLLWGLTEVSVRRGEALRAKECLELLENYHGDTWWYLYWAVKAKEAFEEVELYPSTIEYVRAAANDKTIEPSVRSSLLASLAAAATLGFIADNPEQLYEDLKERPGGPVWDTFIPRRLILGQLAARIGFIDEAEAHYKESLEWSRAAPHLPWVAETCEAYAGILLERDVDDDHTKAVALVDEALAISSKICMRPLMARVLSKKMSLQGIDVSSPQTSIDAVVFAVEAERPNLRPHAAPDGTVTVMFTDIEGSTAMTERLGDHRAQEVLRIHNAIIRQQVAAHQGFEVKSQGDGFMMAFSSARRALECAIAIQQTLAAQNAENSDEPIKVRVGLHTGEAIKEGEDFFGKTVILAARIASQARGGQILVSSLLKALVESSREFDFGEEREMELKGLTGLHVVSDVRWRREG